MQRIEAREPAALGSIEERLHDVSLELPDRLPAGEPSTLRLTGLDEDYELIPVRSWGPFASFERLRARVVLVVQHVVGTEITDDAQIGSLNLAKIWFDEDTSILHIEGHIPVELSLRVEQLDVRAEITDDLVASGRTWGLRPKSA